MRHSRAEKRRRIEAYRRFVDNNPPRMPEEFSHKEWKRVVAYAKSAFIAGYNTGMNDISRPERVLDNRDLRKVRHESRV